MLLFVVSGIMPNTRVTDMGCATKMDARIATRSQFQNKMRRNASRLDCLSDELDNIPSVALRLGYPQQLLSPDLRASYDALRSGSVVMKAEIANHLMGSSSAAASTQPTARSSRRSPSGPGMLSIEAGEAMPDSHQVVAQQASRTPVVAAEPSPTPAAQLVVVQPQPLGVSASSTVPALELPSLDLPKQPRKGSDAGEQQALQHIRKIEELVINSQKKHKGTEDIANTPDHPVGLTKEQVNEAMQLADQIEVEVSKAKQLSIIKPSAAADLVESDESD